MLTRINPDQFDLTHIDILGRGQSVDSYEPTRKGAFIICTHYPKPLVFLFAIIFHQYSHRFSIRKHFYMPDELFFSSQN